MEKFKKAALVLFCTLGLIVSLALPDTARASESVFKIQNTEIVGVEGAAEAEIVSYDELSLLNNVRFYELGDAVIYKLTIQNTDTKEHTIDNITDNNSNSFVKYSYDSHAGELIGGRKL